MFRRVDYAQWADLVPIFAFIATFAVFLYFLIRAIRLSKKDAEYMAHLPLEEQSEQTSISHEH